MRDTIHSVDSRVERIKAMFAAFEEGGVLGVRPFVDEDAEFRPLSGEGKTYRGPKGLAEYLEDLKGRSETLEAEAVGDPIEVGEDCVVWAGRTRLRREEGSLVESQVTWVYRFEGDKLVRAVAYPGRLEPDEACARLAGES